MTAEIFPDILCLGEPMVEFVRSDDMGGDTYIAGVGGDTSNAAIAAARQGAKVGYLTALGQDRFGDRIQHLWERENVDFSTVWRDPDAPTGLYVIDPDPAERHYSYFRAGSAASRYSPERLPATALAKAVVLHVSGITLAVSDELRASAFEAIRQVLEAGGKVSLDTNLRLKLWDAQAARKVIGDAATHASVLITSIEDSEVLTGLTDPRQILSHYSDIGCEVIVLTLGEKGAMLSVNGAVGDIAPGLANPVDSTGAGDSFAGAFLAWWLETGDPWKAAELAAIVAAGTVSGLGAVEPIPHRAEVLAKSSGANVNA